MDLKEIKVYLEADCCSFWCHLDSIMHRIHERNFYSLLTIVKCWTAFCGIPLHHDKSQGGHISYFIIYKRIDHILDNESAISSHEVIFCLKAFGLQKYYDLEYDLDRKCRKIFIMVRATSVAICIIPCPIRTKSSLTITFLNFEN